MAPCSVCHELKPYRFDSTIGQLRDASSHGCKNCKVILTAIHTIFEDQGRSLDDLNVVKWSENSMLEVQDRLGDNDYYQNGVGADSSNFEMVKFQIFTTANTVFKELCTDESEGLRFQHGEISLFTSSRLLEDYSGSDKSIMLIKDWIDDCVTNHPKCQQVSSVSPTRLLDIGNAPGNAIKLCSGKGKSAAYLALSHCWGKIKPMQTDRSSLTEHQAAIPFDGLPKTFQDAIVLTRKLAVRYLWIDSLCIVQDDPEEWERESSQMASIYENALLVICATSARDSTKGLFSTRQIPRMSSIPFAQYTRHIDGEHIPLFVRPRIDHGLHHFFDDDRKTTTKRDSRLPLLTRCWALQERFLATKAIHFVEQEIFWECRSGNFCECTSLNRSVANKFQMAENYWIMAANEEDSKLKWFYWDMIVAQYMSFDITNPLDCLPALSGIATKMQALGAGGYAAGLWTRVMFHDLLWHTDGNAFRSEQWRAPSWSWASMQHGVVLYNHLRNENMEVTQNSNGDGLFHLELSSSSTLSSETKAKLPRVTILEINCPPVGKDSTGQVSQESSMTISAPLIEMSIEEDTSNNLVLMRDGIQFDVSLDCLPEAQEMRSRGHRVSCLWIKTSSWGIPQLLVLRKSVGICGISPTAHAFERVGIYNSRIQHPAQTKAFKKWLSEASTETVKVV